MRILVWDLPVRLIHWLLAGLFVGALTLAAAAEEKSAAFAIHAPLAIVAVFLLGLRLVWGLVGSRTARFGAFSFRPSSLAAYLRAAMGLGPRTHHDGHNPASSWFTVGLFAGLLGLGATGFVKARGIDAFEDLHQALAWGVAALVVMHVAGLLWHRVRHRENLAWSMVSGKREGEPGEAIPSSRPGSGAVVVLLTAAWGAAVFNGFDPATRRLTIPLIGTTLSIGDEEGKGERRGSDPKEPRRDADKDDDQH